MYLTQLCMSIPILFIYLIPAFSPFYFVGAFGVASGQWLPPSNKIT